MTQQPRNPSLKEGNQNDMPCSFFGFSGVYPTSDGNIEIVSNHNKVAVFDENIINCLKPLQIEGVDDEDDLPVAGRSAGLLYKRADSDDLFWSVGGRVVNLCLRSPRESPQDTPFHDLESAGASPSSLDVDSEKNITPKRPNLTIQTNFARDDLENVKLNPVSTDSSEPSEITKSAEEVKHELNLLKDEYSAMRNEMHMLRADNDGLRLAIKNMNNIITLVNKNWVINSNDAVLKIEALERIIEKNKNLIMSEMDLANAHITYAEGLISNDFLQPIDHADHRVVARNNHRCEMLDMYVTAASTIGSAGVLYSFYYTEDNSPITELRDESADEILDLLYYLPSNSLISLVVTAGVIELRAVKLQSILSRKTAHITAAVLEGLFYNEKYPYELLLCRDWLFVHHANTLIYVKISADNNIHTYLRAHHKEIFSLHFSQDARRRLCALDEHSGAYAVNMCPSSLVWRGVCDNTGVVGRPAGTNLVVKDNADNTGVAGRPTETAEAIQGIIRFRGGAFEKGRNYYIADGNPAVSALTKKRFGNVLFGRALSSCEILLLR